MPWIASILTNLVTTASAGHECSAMPFARRAYHRRSNRCCRTNPQRAPTLPYSALLPPFFARIDAHINSKWLGSGSTPFKLPQRHQSRTLRACRGQSRSGLAVGILIPTENPLVFCQRARIKRADRLHSLSKRLIPRHPRRQPPLITPGFEFVAQKTQAHTLTADGRDEPLRISCSAICWQSHRERLPPQGSGRSQASLTISGGKEPSSRQIDQSLYALLKKASDPLSRMALGKADRPGSMADGHAACDKQDGLGTGDEARWQGSGTRVARQLGAFLFGEQGCQRGFSTARRQLLRSANAERYLPFLPKPTRLTIPFPYCWERYLDMILPRRGAT